MESSSNAVFPNANQGDDVLVGMRSGRERVVVDARNRPALRIPPNHRSLLGSADGDKLHMATVWRVAGPSWLNRGGITLRFGLPRSGSRNSLLRSRRAETNPVVHASQRFEELNLIGRNADRLVNHDHRRLPLGTRFQANHVDDGLARRDVRIQVHRNIS